jgi:hypothetical protein
MGRGSGRGTFINVMLLAAFAAAAPSHAQLVNDDRAQAIHVRPGQRVTAALAMATPSADPLPSAQSCPFLGWAAPRRDIWYRFDPPQPDGFLTLDLCGSDFDTSVVLYRLDEATGAIEQFACDDDDCNPQGPTYQSRITAQRLQGDPRPVLVRVAGWSDSVGTLDMRADWMPAAPPLLRFTSGGLFHDGIVQVAREQSTSQGPGTGGEAHAFVEGLAQVGPVRAGGFVSAEIRSGWTDVAALRVNGSIEASQPANAGGFGRFRCADGDMEGGKAPLQLTLDADRYFRVQSAGSVQPTLVAETGCICGSRLTAGTYVLKVDLGVVVEGSESAAQQSIDWMLELREIPFLVADIDGDGEVDGNDLGLLLASWGQGGNAADIDGDGTVDGNDMGALLAGWGT